METIRTYLDNMFAGFADTSELRHLKAELLTNMEEKYNELISNGKTESEAIGIVISEFGDIKELAAELHMENRPPEPAPAPAPAQPSLPLVDAEEATSFIRDTYFEAVATAAGVFLILLGVCGLLFMTTINDDTFGPAIGVPFLLIFVAIATGLFVWSDSRMKRYQYLKKTPFSLPVALRDEIIMESERFHSQKTMLNILGIGLCVASPICVILPSMLTSNDILTMLGVIGLLLLVAFGSASLIFASTVQTGYNRLLGIKGDD